MGWLRRLIRVKRFFLGSVFMFLLYLLIKKKNNLNNQLEIEEIKIPSNTIERVKVVDVLSAKKFVDETPAQPAEFYKYNHRLSVLISAFRAVPDTRDPICADHQYTIPVKRSRVSVIIAFHNEARATLLRTIMSLYRRTSSKYLHELILVDDCSVDASLLSSLAKLNFPPFNNASPSSVLVADTRATAERIDIKTSGTSTTVAIKMQRNTQRLGLIESRNHGATLATGDYLFFLDSHCEANVGWLEPMLARVATETKPTAVSPILDSIDATTFEYRASSSQVMGGFDWNLHFHWVPTTRPGAIIDDGADAGNAFKSPTFAGGTFLISREHFFNLNGFNSQLEIWGGESIEFSIKLWLCGGQIEFVPCSRVGHIFRRQHSFQFTHGHDNGQATYLRNSKIIAESWLDGYKYFFYALKPKARDAPVNISFSSLAQLKHRLQCRPFAWYLRHVYPGLKLPNDDFNAFGTLSSTDRCLQILNPGHPFAYDNSNNQSNNKVKLLMTNCYDDNSNTHWYLNRYNARLLSSTGACLDVSRMTLMPNTSNVNNATGYVVVLQYCRSSVGTQRWIRRGAQLVHADTNLCLDNPLSDVVAVSHCRRVAPSQLFRFSIELQRL